MFNAFSITFTNSGLPKEKVQWVKQFDIANKKLRGDFKQKVNGYEAKATARGRGTRQVYYLLSILARCWIVLEENELCNFALDYNNIAIQQNKITKDN